MLEDLGSEQWQPSSGRSHADFAVDFPRFGATHTKNRKPWCGIPHQGFWCGFETRLRKIRFVVESEVRISYSAAGGGLAQGKNTTKGHGCISEVFGLERIHGIFVSYVFVFVLIVEAGGWEVGCKWGLGLRHQTTNSQFTRKQEPISVVSAQRGLVLLLKERALMLEQAQVCVMFWPALMNDTSHALSFGLVVQKPKSAKHVQN